jgi:SNF2 family DNA or RNA helicase
MKLQYNGEIFWVDATYEERSAPKQAGFLWHPGSYCVVECPACRAGLRKKWWTALASNARVLEDYGDDRARQAISQYHEGLKQSRAADVQDKEAFAQAVPAPEGIDYYPFQKAGIQFALDRQNVLIGDEMGLGKSIQALGIINASNSVKKVLLLCPASLRINWAREAQKWLVKSWGIIVIHKGSDLLELPDEKLNSDTRVMLIINYDKLGGPKNRDNLDKLMGVQWDILVSDESHMLKGEKTQRAKAVLGVYDKKNELDAVGLVHQAEKLVFLTGTPMPNRTRELWPTLRALDPAELGKNFFKFAIRYCDATKGTWGWDFDGASNLPELQNKLRERIMVRRLKSEVLKELPPKRRQIIELPTNGASTAVRDQAERFVQHENTMEDLAVLAEVAEIVGDEEDFREASKMLADARQLAFEELAKERHKVAVAKIPLVVEHVLNILDTTDSKVLVFAHHKDVVRGIQKALDKANIKYATIIGSTPMKKRQAEVDTFQTDPGTRVFLGNIQAAGVGITLTAADTVVFAEIDWVPANCAQAEDRCHRIGQEKSVLIQYLVFDGSVDSKMIKTIVAKMEVIEQALDTEVPAQKMEVLNKKNTRAYPVVPAEAREAAAQVLQQLSAVCDGARTQDAQGFSGADTRFGKALAARSAQRPLTDAEVAITKKLVHKYRRQLDTNLLAKLYVADELFEGRILGDFI